MIGYVDTQVVVWLCEDKVAKFSSRALDALNELDLLVSPMVMIELAYLYEIERIVRAPQDLIKQLKMQLGVRVCDHSFPDLAETALFENWTRDPFDRLIVAHAKSNNYAPLITSDSTIRRHYPKTIW